MKKYFSSGLVILLPIVMTSVVVIFLVNLLTHPFLALTQSILSQTPWIQRAFPFLGDATVMMLTSQILILIGLAIFIILVGVFGEHILINSFFRLSDSLLHKLPLINKIYKTTKDAVDGLFSKSGKDSSQVAFVPFPQINQLNLGLVTQNSIKIKNFSSEETTYRTVFVPGMPNPTIGFMLLFKEEQLHFIDMTTDEAMKMIVSCGTVTSDFKIIATPPIPQSHDS